MGLEQLPTLEMKNFRIIGGMTQSIFPDINDLLRRRVYQKAVISIAGSRRIRKYRSLIDYFFCELYPSWKKYCGEFYDDSGPQLENLMRFDDYVKCNRELETALKIACENFLRDRKQRMGWHAFRKLVSQKLKTA